MTKHQTDPKSFLVPVVVSVQSNKPHDPTGAYSDQLVRHVYDSFKTNPGVKEPFMRNGQVRAKATEKAIEMMGHDCRIETVRRLTL